MWEVDVPDLAGMYRETRERVTGHLAAIPEDALAGRLTGPPSEAETAVQVERFRGRPMARTLAGWTDLAPRFEEIVAAFDVVPAVIDVASHEQDIRGAVGQPGARDTEVIRELAGWLLTRSQLAALDWSGDPVPVLDHLVVFGPAVADVIE